MSLDSHKTDVFLGFAYLVGEAPIRLKALKHKKKGLKPLLHVSALRHFCPQNCNPVQQKH